MTMSLPHPVHAVQDVPASVDDPCALHWSVVERDVWAASGQGPDRAVAAGFVHLVDGRYLAVDGLGAGIGAYDDLVVAQSAVALAVTTTLAPSIWMRGL